MTWFRNATCKVLGSTFVLGVTAAGVIDCYGHNRLAYHNNSRCPGSNACCGVGATCLSNRLCHNPSDGPGTFVRGPCAVNPYDSGTCAQICLYDEVNGVFPRVAVCSDGSLCCNDDSQCCQSGRGTFLDDNGSIANSTPSTTFSYGPERTAATFRISNTASISTATPSSTLTSTESSTWTAIPSDAMDLSKDQDNSRALKIGLGVGVPVACFFSGLVAFLYSGKRRVGKGKAVELSSWQEKPPGQPAAFQGQNTIQYAVELDATSIRRIGISR
ncbi:Uncharacterized protein TPAR_02987 [Tolypocladium paradoxum]|uniref:Mid2 domain-containing protein n=1 Tax=Tolypocladium paradoxum TaxID=94208 RepID=A0A2S4L301_9HYPO|nr:Uncharacterized protein TPAR_02987 [Tolypocladium paradoxum]